MSPDPRITRSQHIDSPHGTDLPYACGYDAALGRVALTFVQCSLTPFPRWEMASGPSGGARCGGRPCGSLVAPRAAPRLPGTA